MKSHRRPTYKKVWIAPKGAQELLVPTEPKVLKCFTRIEQKVPKQDTSIYDDPTKCPYPSSDNEYSKWTWAPPLGWILVSKGCNSHDTTTLVNSYQEDEQDLTMVQYVQLAIFLFIAFVCMYYMNIFK